jgi:hypothetical protein
MAIEAAHKIGNHKAVAAALNKSAYYYYSIVAWWSRRGWHGGSMRIRPAMSFR